MDYVVLGAGIAGVSAIREIIKRRKPADRITLITEEAYPFYYRPWLIECLSGQVGIEQIMIHRQDWFADFIVCGSRRCAVARYALRAQYSLC